METIFLTCMILSLVIIFAVDTRQKRNRYMDQGK